MSDRKKTRRKKQVKPPETVNVAWMRDADDPYGGYFYVVSDISTIDHGQDIYVYKLHRVAVVEHDVRLK